MRKAIPFDIDSNKISSRKRLSKANCILSLTTSKFKNDWVIITKIIRSPVPFDRLVLGFTHFNDISALGILVKAVLFPTRHDYSWVNSAMM